MDAHMPLDPGTVLAQVGMQVFDALQDLAHMMQKGMPGRRKFNATRWRFITCCAWSR